MMRGTIIKYQKIGSKSGLKIKIENARVNSMAISWQLWSTEWSVDRGLEFHQSIGAPSLSSIDS